MHDKNFGRDPLGSGDVVVKISVAEMSESHHSYPPMGALKLRVRRRDELGNTRDGNRHVVLDIRAFMGLRFGDEFAKAPERLGLSFTLRDRRVENVLLFESPFEHAFDQSSWAFTRLGVREFH